MRLRSIVFESNNIVFFGGAGVSTQSGIPDFRTEGGLYSRAYKYPPETVLSHRFLTEHTRDFFDYYRSQILPLTTAEPNDAHTALARLEEMGKLKAVITQNIDGLHQKAGSKNVLELHGSVYCNYCERCKRAFDISIIQNSEGVPICRCGGFIRPDVVLYEESLNIETVSRAKGYISRADVLIVGGTSLSVYPAAGLIDIYRGDKLVLINREKTPKDSQADLIIRENIADVLGEAVLL